MTPSGVRPEVARPGQESVWDYPRPPRVEPTGEHVVVRLGRLVVAETDEQHLALRVLETSHPPTYYLPVEAFFPGSLEPGQGSSWCEYKGRAAYLERVRPQAGGFYGGWITDRVAGPFKGGPGTTGW